MLPFPSRLLDFIYPALCQICECSLTHGRHLCDPCSQRLRKVESPFCEQCGECYDGLITDTFICPNCNNLTFTFDFARAAFHSEGDARRLIHDFKYLRHIHLGPELGRLAEIALEDPRFIPYRNFGILVPVPLFWRRQRNRRFNQSEHIARHLSSRTGIPYLPALKRIRHTDTQTRFSRAKRLKNLKNAFAVKKSCFPRLQNSSIILIDDVFTTGSTVNECAKELLKAGASDVAVLTVLRG